MSQTLLVVILFIGAVACLPWLVRRLQQRRAEQTGMAAGMPKIVSAIAVGPHQRVVTIEVGAEHARTTLVLGVTAQSIQCLHTAPAAQAHAPSGPAFAAALEHAGTAPIGHAEGPPK